MAEPGACLSQGVGVKIRQEFHIGYIQGFGDVLRRQGRRGQLAEGKKSQKNYKRDTDPGKK